MKKNRLLLDIISIILALTVAAAVSAVSVFAVGEDDAQTESAVQEQQAVVTQTDAAQYEPEQNVEPVQSETVQETPVQTEAEQAAVVETEQNVETTAPEREPMYEYIYGYSEDATSAYEAPQHLGELPEVSSSEVVEATAVAIPDVVVSDATVFSGIVMWLCVALGIAVIVGVLVSKRTRRRGV